MTMTDPIADMLTRLRNANQAYHDAVTMPYSKLKAGVADILQQEGYVTSYKVDEPTEGAGRQDADDHPEVRPEPGALDRRHPPDQQARPACVRQGQRAPQGPGGLGIAIISTSQGLLTDRQANQKGVGGEVLAYVW
jgi:small subunit ribosomal protein S8